MTTCLETFEERFGSFLHRHGDVTGKPETRDETRGCSKTSISCETYFDSFFTLSNTLECHKVPRLPRKTRHIYIYVCVCVWVSFFLTHIHLWVPASISPKLAVQQVPKAFRARGRGAAERICDVLRVGFCALQERLALLLQPSLQLMCKEVRDLPYRGSQSWRYASYSLAGMNRGFSMVYQVVQFQQLL